MTPALRRMGTDTADLTCDGVAVKRAEIKGPSFCQIHPKFASTI